MLTSQANIAAGLYTYINATIGTGNPSLDNIDIYELEAEQNEALPVAVYQIISDVPQISMGQCDSIDLRVQVSFFGEKELGVQNLRQFSDGLVQSLHKTNSIVISGKSYTVSLVLNRGTPTIKDDVIQIIIEFKMLSN